MEMNTESSSLPVAGARPWPADKVERRPIADLVPYARNARTHSDVQVDQIAASIREWGWTIPVLVDESGMLIAGHGRIMAAHKLGIAEVPVMTAVGWTEAQKRAYILADNQLALNAGWNTDLLSLELADLQLEGFDLDLLGFGDQLTDLLDPSVTAPPEKDPDAVPPVPDAAISVPGDVWVCGPHRVCCGDSTSVTDWDKLMAGEKADVCWTDPPYNVAYESKLAGKIKNDDMGDDKFRAFLQDAFAGVFTVMKAGAAIYVAHADTEGYNFRHSFREAGFKLSGCLVWKKDSLVLGRSDFQWMHEPILYGWKPGSAHRWYGGRKLTTVQDWGGDPITKLDDGRYQIVVGDRVLTVAGEATLEESPSSVIYHEKPKRSDSHPTMKPTGLIEKMLKCSARSGDLVADAFGGSGSTLIAADRLGMSARLMELDTKFVDVIVRRWEEYTGRRAVHAETGELFPEIKIKEQLNG